MSSTREQKEVQLREHTRKTVVALLSINEDTCDDVTVVSECRRIAIDIGNLMAPQLYGNRVHGIGNAVSVCVRLCSEALFWLDMLPDKPKHAIEAVEILIGYLSMPTL